MNNKIINDSQAREIHTILDMMSSCQDKTEKLKNEYTDIELVKVSINNH